MMFIKKKNSKGFLTCQSPLLSGYVDAAEHSNKIGVSVVFD